jgi:hypothetical protein
MRSPLLDETLLHGLKSWIVKTTPLSSILQFQVHLFATKIILAVFYL